MLQHSLVATATQLDLDGNKVTVCRCEACGQWSPRLTADPKHMMLLCDRCVEGEANETDTG